MCRYKNSTVERFHTRWNVRSQTSRNLIFREEKVFTSIKIFLFNIASEEEGIFLCLREKAAEEEREIVNGKRSLHCCYVLRLDRVLHI